MSAPRILKRERRPPAEIREAQALGKKYREVGYSPRFALGVLCTDEAEQEKYYRRLAALLPAERIKVLVI